MVVTAGGVVPLALKESRSLYTDIARSAGTLV